MYELEKMREEREGVGKWAEGVANIISVTTGREASIEYEPVLLQNVAASNVNVTERNCY